MGFVSSGLVPVREISMSNPSVLESILARDRTIVITGLMLVIVLAWLYLLLGTGVTPFKMTTPGAGSPVGIADHNSSMSTPQEMGGTMQMAQQVMMQSAVWTPAYALLMGVMWWVMMMAMMLPSAAPMILLFARIQRREQVKGAPFVPTSIFTAGYLLIWGLFSGLATGVQWGLEYVGLVSTMMVSTSGRFAGILLLVAGLYQLTPLKHTCLKHCQSPIQFLTQHWRNGTTGAFRMGIEHGAFCTGCCWLLMALLFVNGVMNLYWIGSLAILVLLEKILPVRHWLGSLVGIGLILWGGWMIVGTL
jgi:predicted metal-binding membrane protein